MYSFREPPVRAPTPPPPQIKQPTKHPFLSKNENLWTNVYVVFRGVGDWVPPRGSFQQLAARRHRLSQLVALSHTISHRRNNGSSPPSVDEYSLVAAGGSETVSPRQAAEADVRSGIPGCCLIGSLLAHSSLDCWLTDFAASRLRSL